MDPDNQGSFRAYGLGRNVPPGFRDLLQGILQQAHRSYSQSGLLRHACEVLLPFSGADQVSVRIENGGKTSWCRATQTSSEGTQVEMGVVNRGLLEFDVSDGAPDAIPEPILQAILSGGFAAPVLSFTRGRSFWTGDSTRPILLQDPDDAQRPGRTVIIGGEFLSLALIVVPLHGHSRGVIFLASRRQEQFSREDVQLYEVVAAALGVALAHQATQWALGERVKELTCLYSIERIASHPGVHLEEILPEIVELLPPGWQYPEITVARIQLDKNCFVSKGFRETSYLQSAEILVNDRPRGKVEVFYLESKPDIDEGPFLKEERNLIEAVAETIGRLASQHETQWALRERVKELTCLYGISTVASRPDISQDVFFDEVVKLLPPGWQYPEVTEARITLDNRSYATARYADSPYCQKADIFVDERMRGSVEVVYTEEKSSAFEGPFLKEERHLINEIARQLGFIVERWEAEQQAKRLQEQLRHAERLATVGQLSAGIAHELNEPLGAILGFAELAKESKETPKQVGRDIGMIIDSALHAREIIHKLMIFTRQMPTRKEKCDLNHLVREGLYFLESRCIKEGITVTRRLEPSLPHIMADPSQLHQVLVNLVVNAIQAMPSGGKLTITTYRKDSLVCFAVEDTGVGMSPEIQKQLFVPFFTTKDVGQGTGLGLAVIQGIVTAHGGTIAVRSQTGQGSLFEVCLPREHTSGSNPEVL
jgi:signal transduction histidine kinase